METEEKVTVVNGLKEVAKDLKQDLHLFQDHICRWKGLSYVKVKDVTFETDHVYLTIEVNKDSLQSFYDTTKEASNELSRCLEDYFYKQCIACIAGLSLDVRLSCIVQMTRRDFFKARSEKQDSQK